MRKWISLLFMVTSQFLHAQVAGGNTVYNFMKLSAGALQSSLGGENISVLSRDVTMAYSSPSLLRNDMDRQLGFGFTALPGGVKNLHFTGALDKPGWGTVFSTSLQYFNYGSIQQTDASGNMLGNFTPRDYVAQVAASRQYGRHWFYGAALKYIRSDYGQYRSSAIAMDIGVNFSDSLGKWQVGLLMKNMGIQLQSFSGEGSEELPFDLQLGITKRLLNAPVQFSLTLRELHRFLLYNADSTGVFDHVMQHAVFAMQFFIADKIELTAGYNHLRRMELRIPNTTNGLTGFSMGIGALLPKIQLRYARAYLSNSKGYNQFGLNIDLR